MLVSSVLVRVVYLWTCMKERSRKGRGEAGSRKGKGEGNYLSMYLEEGGLFLYYPCDIANDFGLLIYKKFPV